MLAQVGAVRVSGQCRSKPLPLLPAAMKAMESGLRHRKAS